MSQEERKNAASGQETDGASKPETQGRMSVFPYILILFSAALLLMCLSSLIHQRNNTEVLGELQNSVSVMQEVQNLQDKIITLQDARRDLETQLEQAQKELSAKLGRGVRIVNGRKKGRIELDYYGLDDLNDLLDALALLQIRQTREGYAE